MAPALLSDMMTLDGYIKDVLAEDASLTEQEALHWVADSDEASRLFAEDFVAEAEEKLKTKYPKWSKNFWWIV